MRGEMKTRQDEPGVYADPLLNAVVLENRSKVVPLALVQSAESLPPSHVGTCDVWQFVLLRQIVASGRVA